MRRYSWLIAILIISSLMMPSQTKAYDLAIICEEKECYPENDKVELFTEKMLWYPGLTVDRSVKLINHTGERQQYSIRLKKLDNTKNVSRVMKVKITDKANRTPIWEGTMLQMKRMKEIRLMHIPGWESREIGISVQMLPSAGNEYQEAVTELEWQLGIVEKKQKGDVLGKMDSKEDDSQLIRYYLYGGSLTISLGLAGWQIGKMTTLKFRR